MTDTDVLPEIRFTRHSNHTTVLVCESCGLLLPYTHKQLHIEYHLLIRQLYRAVMK